MVISCCAYNCTNRWGKLKEGEKKLQFHKFPFHNPQLLKKWILAVRRKDFVPSNATVLCSNHFKDEDYRSSAKRYLKITAVPSVFDFPSHLMSKKGRKPLFSQSSSPVSEHTNQKRRHCSNNASTNSDEKTTPSTPTKAKLQRKKLLLVKLRQKDKEIKDLESLLYMAQKYCDMSENTSKMLKNTYGELPFETIIRQPKKHCTQPYSTTMKEFATTLYFYSSRSYNYLRKKISLPHPYIIRSWVNSTNCYPGFLDEALAYLKKVTDLNDKNLDCALIIDGMTIRKQSVWDKERRKYGGYVEIPGVVDGNECSLASEALVFLVVSFSEKCKVPVAYFLTENMCGEILSQLIKVCLTKLHNVGVNIRSLTCDGISYNVKAVQLLGCKIHGCSSYQDFQTYFQHPNSSSPVYVVFDPCHMLKLARNILAEKHSLVSSLGNISWSYLKSLKSLQDKLEFKIANEQSAAHINCHNKIMTLAAPTFSNSTANALEYLMQTKDNAFLGAEATIQFIRMVNRIFDVLNSRNMYGKGDKAPLTLENIKWWMNVFSETTEYFLSLKLGDIPVVRTQRKMFAIGFLVTIKSVSMLAFELLTKTNPFKYILTYKVSQDQIELFFNSIRASGGFNSIPNVNQFRWSIRKLLIDNISAKNSNCISNGVIVPSIIEFRSPKRSLKEPIFSDEEQLVLSVYSECLDSIVLSEYLCNLLYYIGGYIVKNIIKELTCLSCISMLTSNESKLSSNYHNHQSFTTFIPQSGLKKCSPIVFKIVLASEKAFKYFKNDNKEITSNSIDFELKAVINEYIQNEGIKFHHPIENEIGFEDLHESQIIALIFKRYLNIRSKQFGKDFTLKEAHNNMATAREKLTKLILFQNV